MAKSAKPTSPVFSADDLVAEEEFESKQFTAKGENGLNYRIYVPRKINIKKTYPLCLLLHGAGERGNDNALQVQNTFGPLEILAFCRTNNFEVIIIAPQVPEAEQWVNVPWDGFPHSMPSSPSSSMQMTIDLMNHCIDILPVDQSRIYVSGISMGGFGTWDIVQRCPDLFAAAMPVCGGGDEALATKIKRIPIWAFHGDNDETVSVDYSRDMVAAVNKTGGNVRYTEYKGVGHNSWEQTYADHNVLKWLFEQEKK